LQKANLPEMMPRTGDIESWTDKPSRSAKSPVYSRAKYACGITALTSAEADADAFAATMAEEAGRCGAGFGYLFFSMQTFDPYELNTAMLKHAPGLEVVGCSTSGEITPDGIGEGHALAILLPAKNFTVVSTTIENIATSGMDAIAEEVDRLRRELDEKTLGKTGHDRFAMCLIDGMSFAEEKITAALHWALDDIPLIGGSAGDDLKFEHTVLISNGKVSDGSAIVMLVSTAIPFSIFKTDNFIPTDAKFVVTASDPERRTVSELNATAAALEYASAVGKDIASLTQSGFASHPVVVKVGGEFYCRAVRGIQEDGSLVFACAIDDGVVLTLAEARGMVETTRTKLQEIEERLGGIDMVFGFDCAYRRVDAENRQVIRKMSELYQHNHVIGFGTYGEQYQSMHLNQTLTGIAFGRRTKEAVLPAAAE
jgi:hypothetical protein